MPASVELSRLFDPTLERVGFPLDHPYLEQVYCSVLGPSSVLLLRRAGQLFAEHPEGLRLDVVDLSRSLGLGVRADADDVGRHSPLRRTMDRWSATAWRRGVATTDWVSTRTCLPSSATASSDSQQACRSPTTGS